MTGPIIDVLRGGLVVSCQAYPGEPLRDSYITRQVALSVVAGGAAGVRVQGLADVQAVVEAVEVPVIGIWKDGSDGVVITPTLGHALALADAGAQIIGLDGTRRRRQDGRTLAETITGLKGFSDVLVMADCGSLDDALAAQDAGADILGTTLSGYTGERRTTTGPDLELVRLIADACNVPVMAEGRIRSPEDVAAAFDAGAFSVCVGTAITHPTSITRTFVERGTRL